MLLFHVWMCSKCYHPRYLQTPLLWQPHDLWDAKVPGDAAKKDHFLEKVLWLWLELIWIEWYGLIWIDMKWFTWIDRWLLFIWTDVLIHVDWHRLQVFVSSKPWWFNGDFLYGDVVGNETVHVSSKETSKVRRAASCQRTKLWPAARPAFKIRKNAAETPGENLNPPPKKKWRKQMAIFGVFYKKQLFWVDFFWGIPDFWKKKQPPQKKINSFSENGYATIIYTILWNSLDFWYEAMPWDADPPARPLLGEEWRGLSKMVVYRWNLI